MLKCNFHHKQEGIIHLYNLYVPTLLRFLNEQITCSKQSFQFIIEITLVNLTDTPFNFNAYFSAYFISIFHIFYTIIIFFVNILLHYKLFK